MGGCVLNYQKDLLCIGCVLNYQKDLLCIIHEKKKKKVFRIIGTKRDGGKWDESKGKDGQNMINFSAF